MQAVSKKSKILVIGALPESLVNFRGELIRSMAASGHEVIAMAAEAEPDTVTRIEGLGATFRHYRISRSGLDPFSDLSTLIDLARAIRNIRPDIVLCYTIKPVIYGGLASRFARGNRFFAIITGLGYAFSGATLKRRLLRKAVSFLYKISLQKAKSVIFQNADNLELFERLGIVHSRKQSLIAGSGIDVNYFSKTEMPSLPVKVLMASRLLREKGVLEFCEAAAIAKTKFPDAQFLLAGPVDPSPDAISIDTVNSFVEKGAIRYLGNVTDIRDAIRNCHLFALPSYHEGRPRTVQEALAMGRPVLTTDTPGCRDSVEPGKSGFLVPAQNSQALASEFIRLLSNPEAILAMHADCRNYAEEHYDVKNINFQICKILGLRLNE